MLCDANLENVHKSENMKEPNEDAPVPLQETSMDEVNLMLIPQSYTYSVFRFEEKDWKKLSLMLLITLITSSTFENLNSKSYMEKKARKKILMLKN